MTPLPEPEPLKPPTLISDLKKAKHYGELILLVSSIPAIGIPGLVAKLLHADELIGLWQLIVATAPLTAAATVVGIAILSKKYGFPETLFGTVVALFGSIVLGIVLGRELPIKTLPTGGNPFGIIYWILSGYFRLYGIWSFATSLVVGGFLAWAWSKMLWPRLSTGFRSGHSTKPDHF